MDANERETQISHLEAIREDLRDEVKQRILQRDTYIIQMSVGLAAVVALAVTQNKLGLVILAPLVSLYYTYLIAYSYGVHEAQTRYLREVLEPGLATLCGRATKDEWENWYQYQVDEGNMEPTRRKTFLLWGLWAVCLLLPAYVLCVRAWKATSLPGYGILAVLALYVSLAAWVTKRFH